MSEGLKPTASELEFLVELATRLGATAASVIPASGIVVEDRLADFCRKPRCENYGQSAKCPPHIGGPAEYRELLKQFTTAVVFKIDVPSDILLSAERREVFRLLHEIAADIEREAIRRGYRFSQAFAGGSCKRAFCNDEPACRVLTEGGTCRHPDHARSSMSGYGINVSRLMDLAGWPMKRITRETDTTEIPMGAISGLVLIG